MTGELGSQCPILLTIKLHIHRIMDWQKKFEVWLPRSHYFKTKSYENVRNPKDHVHLSDVVNL